MKVFDNADTMVSRYLESTPSSGKKKLRFASVRHRKASAASAVIPFYLAPTRVDTKAGGTTESPWAGTFGETIGLLESLFLLNVENRRAPTKGSDSGIMEVV